MNDTAAHILTVRFEDTPLVPIAVASIPPPPRVSCLRQFWQRWLA